MDRRAGLGVGRWWSAGVLWGAALVWGSGSAWAQGAGYYAALGRFLEGVLLVAGGVAAVVVVSAAASSYLLARRAPLRGSRWMVLHGFGTALSVLGALVSWVLVAVLLGLAPGLDGLLFALPALVLSAPAVLAVLVWRRWRRERA